MIESWRDLLSPHCYNCGPGSSVAYCAKVHTSEWTFLCYDCGRPYDNHGGYTVEPVMA